MTASGRLPASLLRLKERHRQLTSGRQDSRAVMNYHFSMTALDGIQLLAPRAVLRLTSFNLQPGIPPFPVHVSHPTLLLCCTRASLFILLEDLCLPWRHSCKQGSSNFSAVLFSGGNLGHL